MKVANFLVTISFVYFYVINKYMNNYKFFIYIIWMVDYCREGINMNRNKIFLDKWYKDKYCGEIINVSLTFPPPPPPSNPLGPVGTRCNPLGPVVTRLEFWSCVLTTFLWGRLHNREKKDWEKRKMYVLHHLRPYNTERSFVWEN